MLIYLLKLTVIWGILLLAYELLYKNSANYTANRFFLILSLILGITLPLIPSPWRLNSIGTLQQAPIILVNSTTPQQSKIINSVTEENVHTSITIENILIVIYTIVAITLLSLCLVEIVKILRKAIYGKYTISGRHRIFESNKEHAPFSFMGWIFITEMQRFTTEELDFILAHEAAHNSKKHWIDVMVMQSLCIAFWFHPLIWRYRYLLKMQHEFEADKSAAIDKEYEYGHFLLQQTLLKGTPSIAHSFHFSPIKNRIMMLTKKSKMTNWKYLAILPVLAVCTMAMDDNDRALERKTNGTNTIFKANRFEWMERPDKDVVMAVWGSDERYVGKHPQHPAIVRMNGDSVYSNESPFIIPAQYRVNNEHYYEALNKKFKEMVNPLPDSIDDVNIMNIVIDKQGSIAYYDLEYHCKSSGHKSIPYWDKKIDDVISTLPNWLPAVKDGKPIASFQEIAGAIRINENPRTFSIRPLSKEEVQKMSKEKKDN